MKPHPFLLPAILALAGFISRVAAAGEPRITSIDFEKDQLVISAEAPAGTARLVLEGSERGSVRAWRPRAVHRLESAGPVTFRLPINLAATLGVEMFRVRADTNDPLPAAFYTGKTEFRGDPAPAGSPMLMRGKDGAEFIVGNAVPNVLTDAGAPTPTTPQRTVAESDIWRLQGNRLYFFNQQRGLQIVDVSNPDSPALLATFALPASGEQMYLLGDHHVVLLARGHPCESDWGQNARNAVIIIDVTGDQPREVARVPLEGRILESRLVGTALYVANDQWHEKSDRPEDAGAWINGTSLTGIDLSNPAKPTAQKSAWLAGSGNVVTATEKYLMVGIQSQDGSRWWESNLNLFDIQDPAGAIRKFASVRLSGRLQDKFKLHVNGDILTAITAGPSNPDGSGAWRSSLATYRLAGSADNSPSATRLGSIEVGHGEQLYATRFDGTRAYLVTFRQVDPLWIVDLSSPEQPRVLGELEIPGWSTYIQPLGDRLLTVGIDTTGGNRAAVQLFNVADPAKPQLLSKIPLGNEWSWSEANSDEKALGVFPDAGLVLVPFSSSGANQQIQAVQVIDLGRDTLTARGRIESQNVVPRRTALSGDRVLAVSSRDLTAVSIADRDHPQVRSRLELSYPVERVIPTAGILVEFSQNLIRTRAVNNPTETRAQLELENLPVLGATLQDGRIYVLQGRGPETVWKNEQWITNAPAAVKLTVLDASVLPKLTVLGSTSEPVDGWPSGEFEARWPQPGLLVWAPLSSSFSPWYYRGFPGTIDLAPIPVTLDAGTIQFSSRSVVSAPVSIGKPATIAVWDGDSRFFWGGWNPTPSALYAFNVATPAQPALASVVQTPDGGYSISPAFASDGLLYFSHDSQFSRITGTNTYTYIVAEPVTTKRDIQVTNYVQIPHEGLVTNVFSKEFSVPAWLVSPPDLASVQAGTLHAVGLDAQGTAFGWGDNRSGQLGSLTLVYTDLPIQIPFPGPATALAAAKWFTLARLNDGSVWMSGTPIGPDGPPLPGDASGASASGSPHRIDALPADIVDIAAGYHQAFARSAGGALFAWGRNERGQLGTGNDQDQPTPVALQLPAPVVAVAGGGLHSLALTQNGSVLGWGDNQHNQLGASSPDRVLAPEPIQGLASVRAIAAGDFHSLALDQSDAVWSWGELSENEPGSGALPQPVKGLPPIRTIAAGRYHSLAVDYQGRVWSWGAHTSEPYQVQPMEAIQSVSARGSYALANGVSGKTYIWQLDDYPTPGAGTKTGLTLLSNMHTNVEMGIVYTVETKVVTKSIEETHWVESTVTNSYPVFEYSTLHHLNVVDFNGDITKPVIRPPVPIPGSLSGISHQGALLYTLSTRGEADPTASTRTWIEASAYDGTVAHLVTSLEVANASKGQSALLTLTPAGSLWLAQSDGDKNHSLAILSLSGTGKFEKLAAIPLGNPTQSLTAIGETLAVSFGGTVQLFEASAAPAISSRGLPFDLGCLLPSVNRIAGDTTSGFWAPLGDYGSSPLP